MPEVFLSHTPVAPCPLPGLYRIPITRGGANTLVLVPTTNKDTVPPRSRVGVVSRKSHHNQDGVLPCLGGRVFLDKDECFLLSLNNGASEDRSPDTPSLTTSS